mgnify:CR=1 FL=1
MIDSKVLRNFKSIVQKAIIPSIMLGVYIISKYLLQDHFELFTFFGLIIGVSCFLLSLIVFGFSRNKIHAIWAWFNVSVSIWGWGCYFIGVSFDNYAKATISWKVFVSGITFIPILCYHFVSEYAETRNYLFLRFCYFQGICFLIINIFSEFLVNRLIFRFNSFYYLQASVFYSFYFTIWSLIVCVSFLILFKYYNVVVGLRRIQAAYLFYGMLLGFLGGSTTAPLAWGINLYPYGHFLTWFYAVISTYAILRYRLLDLNLLLTRTSIFVLVYSIVLGIPFALAFGWRQKLINLFNEGWWLVPLIVMTVLATAGPFIYLYIQRRAEERLFQEQRRYQATLRQASYGMGRIKDLKRLLNLIVHIVTRTVGLEFSTVYIYDLKLKNFQLGASRSRVVQFNTKEIIAENSPLIEQLIAMKEPLVYEEIKQRTQDYGDHKLARLETALKEINAAVVVPSFVDDHLLAFIVLGQKVSNRLYSEEDLVVFSILANQAALAIENAQFYEDVKKTHEQLVRAEKMATIGTMADGLSHQINNRLHALGFIAGDALDSIKLKKNSSLPSDVQELMIDLEHALARIQDNVEQGGEIVQGLLKYTRKGEEGFAPVDLDKLIDAAIEMTQFKIKKSDMIVLRDYANNLPKIKGNFTQLQEVFFNIIDNAYDAMMQRKTERKEPGYQPTLKIHAVQENNHLNIVLEDNGMGVKDEDKQKLFTPFFTTKLSSKKGTGLGLYVIQKIIEENHGGKVAYTSEYMKGTTARVELPVC